MHADRSSTGDRRANGSASPLHIAEKKRVVLGDVGFEEGLRVRRVGIPPPDEHACRRLGEAERACQRRDLGAGARSHPPRALVHVRDSRARVGRYSQAPCPRPITSPTTTSSSSSSATGSASI